MGATPAEKDCHLVAGWQRSVVTALSLGTPELAPPPINVSVLAGDLQTAQVPPGMQSLLTITPIALGVPTEDNFVCARYGGCVVVFFPS